MGLFPICSKCKLEIHGFHECIGTNFTVGKLCPKCYVELPKSGVCDNCE